MTRLARFAFLALLCVALVAQQGKKGKGSTPPQSNQPQVNINTPAQQ